MLSLGFLQFLRKRAASLNQLLSSSSTHLPQQSPPCPTVAPSPAPRKSSILPCHLRCCWSSDWRLYLSDNPMVPGMQVKAQEHREARLLTHARMHTLLLPALEMQGRVGGLGLALSRHRCTMPGNRVGGGGGGFSSSVAWAFLHGPSLLLSRLNFVKKKKR